MTGISLSKSQSKLVLVIIFVLIGILSRLWVSTLGYNYDLESWGIVSELVVNGKNVYANTPRYNYGPVWFIILGAIKWIQTQIGLNDLDSLHILIASFLSLVDLATAFLLAHMFGIGVGLIFFLCPVSIVLTGNHSQFDNLAIFIGLCSWLFIKDEESRRKTNNIIISSILMGLSLATKHILIFFPLWILFGQAFGSLKKRIIFCLIGYSIFFLSFLPFIFHPGALTAIKNQVFGYSLPENALFPRLIDLAIPLTSVSSILKSIPIFSGFKFLFLIAMLATGIFIVRTHPKLAFFYYLISMIVWTPFIAYQYLVIPIIACSVLWHRWQSWAYMLSVSILISFPFLGVLQPLLANIASFIAGNNLQYYRFQIWLFFLLLMTWDRYRLSKVKARS